MASSKRELFYFECVYNRHGRFNYRPALLHLPERGKSRMQLIRDMFGPGHSPLVSGAFFARRFLRFAVPASLESLGSPPVASPLGGTNVHWTFAVFPPRPCASPSPLMRLGSASAVQFRLERNWATSMNGGRPSALRASDLLRQPKIAPGNFVCTPNKKCRKIDPLN